MKITVNFKRTLAVCLALLLFGLSCIFQTNNNNANAANTTQVYLAYNAKTGQFLRQYSLSPLSSQNNSRAIIGTEDRFVDWSKSGTVKLMREGFYGGTGFVVDEHTIVTAAHCVYICEYDEPKKFTNILLFDSQGNIEMTANPVEYHIPRNYRKTSYTEKYDYAIITVEEDLSNYICYNLGMLSDANLINNMPISITGFSQDANGYTNHTAITATGTVTGTNLTERKIISTNAVIAGGNSGGPVYTTETRGGRTYYTVIGISTTRSPIDDIYGYGNCKYIDTNMLHFFINNSHKQYTAS